MTSDEFRNRINKTNNEFTPFTVEELWDSRQYFQSYDWTTLALRQPITPCFYIYYESSFRSYGVPLDVLETWQPEVHNAVVAIKLKLNRLINAVPKNEKYEFLKETYAILKEHDLGFSSDPEPTETIETIIEEVF